MNPADLHPIASASLPWQLVLAIIAFNIVAGMISKRKQGKAKAGANPASKPASQADARKAEAQREKDKSRNLEVMRRQAEARAREAAEAKRKAAERKAREEVQRAGAPERPVVPKETRRAESIPSVTGAEPYGTEDIDPRPAPAPGAVPVAARDSQAVGPGDLADPEVLKKAFIMKIILDKPLALARRR
jgi:hypothetical protein